MDIMQSLNEQQRQAVRQTEGYVRVIAGAGSGKTRTLTSRYVYLARELGIAPGRIMSVTFTNKAANEMKNRIRHMLGDADTGFINTFHGFCLRVLKEDISRLNYPQSFIVMDEEDQKSLLAEIYDELGLALKDYTFKNILNIIGYYKTSYDYVGELTQPDEEKMRKYLQSFGPDTKDRVLGRYIRKQRKNFMLDFDDIINFVLYLFKADGETLSKWQQLLQYIQVDEFQDVDGKQAELVYMLSEGYGNLFVVGDPDQTIYSWRGADVSIILDFDKHFPQAKTIVLDTNYRSTPQILHASNALIRHNTQRIEKQLVPIKAPGPLVTYFHAQTAEEEAAFITGTIKTLLEGGEGAHDIAILYRAHYLSRSLEEALVKENIPYVLYSGVEFYRRREIKDALCYLRMLVSGDDIAFLRTINTPRRNIGKKRVAFLANYAQMHDITLFEALRQNLDDGLFAATKAKSYVRLVDSYRQRMDALSISDLLDGMLRDSGFEEALMKNADQDRIDNVTELKYSIQQYETQAGEDVTLDEYLNKISLFTNLDQQEREGSVRLMTIHTAKGLEFPYVFLCGMSEGIFPSIRQKNKEEMEEERRLAYVAFTRAERRLFLTDSQGVNYDSSYRYPSRFVFNVGYDLLEVIGMDAGEFEKGCTAAASAPSGGGKEAFVVGDRVRHPVFGEGSIVGVGSAGYTIQFDGIKGTREIDFAYSKLEKTGQTP